MSVKLTTENWKAVIHSEECKRRIIHDLSDVYPEHREDVLRALAVRADDNALERMVDILARESGGERGNL